jgi:predicted transcriptional regulator YheO
VHGKDTIDNNRHSLRSDENASKELTELEEVSARIATLVDMLHEKGLINKKVYERTLAMRLHEISKATVFAEMSD